MILLGMLCKFLIRANHYINKTLAHSYFVFIEICFFLFEVLSLRTFCRATFGQTEPFYWFRSFCEGFLGLNWK
jgi:hypothetical protein